VTTKTAGRAAVEQLLYLMGEAFGMLMSNVQSVGDDDWDWAPAGARRTIRQIVAHVASSKHMYDHYAFGEGVWTWTEPPFSDDAVFSPDRPISDLIAWLRDGHQRLIEHVQTLCDDDLPRPMRTNWGQMRPARWILSVMINHDAYHAGEVNHLRALRHGNDRWEWESG
jgi:uncharacterized damage-inducible protein DinB